MSSDRESLVRNLRARGYKLVDDVTEPTDPAPGALDDAWETLAADIHAHGYSVRDAIAVHRPAIEAAALAAAEAAPLDVAWAEASQALRAKPGGSPYLRVMQDLMAWAVAEGHDSSGRWTGEGDTAAEALQALTAALRSDTETAGEA